MQRILISEATEQLAELAEAAINGETVLIVIDEQHEVQLVPTQTERKAARKAGSARGQIAYADDFDAPLPDFDEYTAWDITRISRDEVFDIYGVNRVRWSKEAKETGAEMFETAKSEVADEPVVKDVAELVAERL